jgi:phage RecT family recombinase
MSAQLKSALNGNKPPVRFSDLPRTEQLKSVLMQSKRQITSLLEDETKANKFLAASLIVANSPGLRNCSPESIVQALIGVAMSNLSPDSNISQCYLVPYKDQCQLQIGYRGWVQLLFRAGWMAKCFPVYKCDVFAIEFDGWNNKVTFVPAIDVRDDADSDWVYENLRGMYVIARNSETNDEYSIFVSKNTIEKLRKVSPNQRGADKPQGIWKDWYIEMANAKALKKLAKSLPIGDGRAVTVALATDDKNDIGQKIDYTSTIESGVVTEMNAPISDPQPEETIDEATGEIRTIPEGEPPFVAEQPHRPDPYALGKALQSIAAAKTQEELEAVHVLIAELDNDTGKTAKDAYTKRAAALKKAAQALATAKPLAERDWKAEIHASHDKHALVGLIGQMTEADQAKHRELLDDRLDFLRD